jgi:hypothetical protein
MLTKPLSHPEDTIALNSSRGRRCLGDRKGRGEPFGRAPAAVCLAAGDLLAGDCLAGDRFAEASWLGGCFTGDCCVGDCLTGDPNGCELWGLTGDRLEASAAVAVGVGVESVFCTLRCWLSWLGFSLLPRQSSV